MPQGKVNEEEIYCSTGGHPVYSDYTWKDGDTWKVATYNGDGITQQRELPAPLAVEEMGFEIVELNDTPEPIQNAVQ
jgi:hypothetical protein